MAKTKEPIPVLITLVGDKGVGKSHYLYALGLALKERHSVFRDDWEITQLDENYTKQLDDWNTQYRAEQTISTPTDRFLYLSFKVCNSKRCYKVTLLDWAGENLFQNKLPSTDLTDKLKLELRRSTSTLLMFDATLLEPETQSDFQSKWESLLKQDGFREALTQSLGNVFFDMPLRVCLTHAEFFDNVKHALGVLDDKRYQEYAEQAFESSPHLCEIRTLLKPGVTKFKYYYSAVLVEEKKPRYYNLISPILDTLDDMETIFDIRTHFWSPNQVKWYQSVCDEIERQKKAIDAQQAKNIENIEKGKAFLSSQTTYLENRRNYLLKKKEEIERQKTELDAQKVSIFEASQELKRQKDKFERKKTAYEIERALFERKKTAYENERAFLKKERKKLRTCCSMIKLIFIIGAIGAILYALLAQAAS
jgi:hypothetical protein